MSLYREYKSLDQPALEKEVLNFWKEHKTFERSVDERSSTNPFVFYEGPPSANGMPGIHHVMARTIKDIFCRFKTMQGYRVERKGGWDTHGLPVELSVEKNLGITKEDIGRKISVADYNAECRREVMQYKEAWERVTEQMGYWVDMHDPYVTYDRNYIETLWWCLKRLYDKGYIYEGYTIQPYSPAAGTGLSSHELNQPGTYKPVKDTTIVAQFKAVKDDAFNEMLQRHLADPTRDYYFLAWTTTPWTLPSNTALTVGANIKYACIETLNPYTGKDASVFVAQALVSKYFNAENENSVFENYKVGDKQLPWKLLFVVEGVELQELRYEQLLPYQQPTDGDAFKVVIGDFVTTEDGTGIVHTAPSFGADDFRMSKKHGLGTLTLVDKQGKFVDGVGELSRRYVKDYRNEPNYESPDITIAIKLKQENKAFKVEKYEHNYPHCWRTDKPIIYYPLDSWFIKTTAVKERLIELNKTINWKPASTGEGRFGNWLENLQDWNLSRSRYWGTPLPIWITEDGDEQVCIGSVQELEEFMDKAFKAGVFMQGSSEIEYIRRRDILLLDLHKPNVDEIILASTTGKPMKRVSDLVDVWFDSGAMPYAQWHYPFENEKTFKKNFPADFIAEGVDQTRGWFFTLHALSVLLFDSVAYKNVVSNGLVLDKNGNKMSKRLGNGVDPFEVISKYGADVCRWYMVSNSQPWDNLKFDMSGLDEVRRKFFGTLYNTYSFFALYANVDKFKLDESNITPIHKRPELDRWIISKLHSLVKEVTEAYEDYEPTKAARAIELFVDEHLSNWYVRLSRRRFWKGEMSDDKKTAYETLYECLNVVCQLMAPVAPFFSDWMYRNLTDALRNNVGEKSELKHDSIHLTALSKANEKMIDVELEQRMEMAEKISSLVFSLRKKVNIKVRQPLNRILVPISNDVAQARIEKVKDLILSEVNVKQIEFVKDDSHLVSKKAKANFKLLGQRLGKQMKDVAALVALMNTHEINRLEQDGTASFVLNGEEIEVRKEEVEIMAEDLQGWSVATDSGLTVALDITITPELETEGTAREIVNRIQKLRKEKDFNVTDRISVVLERKPFLEKTLTEFNTYISNEVLADKIALADVVETGDVVDVNDSDLRIQIRRS
jgi:isoleucyl-tRNA synthetase